MEKSKIMTLICENSVYGCAMFDCDQNCYIVSFDFLDNLMCENVLLFIYKFEIKIILLSADFDAQVYSRLAETNTNITLIDKSTFTNCRYTFLRNEKFKVTRKSLKSLNNYLKQNNYINSYLTINKNVAIINNNELLTKIGELESNIVYLYDPENFLHTNIECFDALNIFTFCKEKNNNSKLNKNTLFCKLNFTKTKKGSNLLKNWLKYPLKNKQKIEKRRKDIKYIFDNNLTNTFSQNLKNIVLSPIEDIFKDIVKFSQRFSCIVHKFIFFKEHIKANVNVKTIVDTLSMLEGKLNMKKGEQKFKKGNYEVLDSLNALYENLSEYLNEACIKVNDKYNVTTCIVYYPQLGYLIETNEQINSLEPVFIANAKYFYKDEFIKNLDAEIGDIKSKITDCEVEITNQIYININKNRQEIEFLYDYITYVDCITSLSIAAKKYVMIEPKIIENNKKIEIKGFRNIILDLEYIKIVPVDIRVENTTVLTGYNGSGKSFYMKNIGIAIILNQIGSFIPAKHSFLPIFDKLFVKTNTNESVYNSKSAFLCEILQIQNIKTHANDKSVVILDEFAKGTNFIDGAAIFAAIVNDLNNLFCIYSTHYQSLLNNDVIKNVNFLKFSNNSFTPENGICLTNNIEELLKQCKYDNAFIKEYLNYKDNLIEKKVQTKKKDDGWAIKIINDFLYKDD